MDALISSLDGSSLGGGVQRIDGNVDVYISEVSSPTRFWFQEANSTVLTVLLTQMTSFYNKLQDQDLALMPQQLQKGLRIASKAFQQWDRAEVIGSASGRTGKVKVFYIDYGTTMIVPSNSCKRLLEDFASVPRQSFRGALYGIKPIGKSLLWDLDTTNWFLQKIREKVRRIQIVKHHEHENFYEILLFDDDGCTLNEMLINRKSAERLQTSEPLATCLSYPPYNFLEKVPTYPSYSERVWLKDRSIDFNRFEENRLQVMNNSFAFESQLVNVLNQEQNANIKNSFVTMLGI